MEDTHGAESSVYFFELKGLNPYYNGRYSWRGPRLKGKWLRIEVLILIIMEDTHGVCEDETKLGELDLS